MTTEQELAWLQSITKDIDTPPIEKPKSAIDELKETLLSLREINPALVDSSRIFEHLLTLVDASAVAKETDTKIQVFIDDVQSLQETNIRLLDSIGRLSNHINSLVSQVQEDREWMLNFKSKVNSVLDALQHYLRTH